MYLWFHENHDELTAVFDRSAPSWSKLAEVLGTHGVLDGDGKQPTARGARGAWARVRADVKKTRERRAPSSVKPTTPTLTPIAEAIEPSPDTEAWAEFQVAKPPATGTNVVPQPHRAPIQERRDPDEVIASLLARPRQGSIPMPPIPEPEDN